MRRSLYRFTALLLSLLFLLPASPLTLRVRADEELYDERNAVTVNVSSLTDMRKEDAAAIVRQAMKERRPESAVRFHFDLWFTSQSEADGWVTAAENWYESNWKDIIRRAMEHTGVSTEGDYLFYHLKSYSSGYSLRAHEGGVDFVLIYTFAYLSDTAEEAAVSARLNTLMPSLNLTGQTEAGKVRTIYRWITEHVTFDDQRDRTPYTAYGALIDEAAVCQGISGLFYRMALEAGLDARIISGTALNSTDYSNAGTHAWNIVRIGGVYYNLDATWDVDQSEWHWFLRGSGDFDKSHIAEKTDRLDYTSSAFRQAYPVAARDYDGPFGDEYVAPAVGETPPVPANPPVSNPPATGNPQEGGSSGSTGSYGWQNPFTDVSPKDIYYDAVRYVYENGLFYGVSDHEFAPSLTMTRAMFVTVLGRMARVEADYSRRPSFTDTEAGLWYSPYVDWAAEKGFVLGYGDGRFGPDDPVTREQAAVITARMAAWEGVGTSTSLNLDPYDRDDPVSDWARAAVAWGLDRGVYPAESGLLPHTLAPRSFVARMLARYAELRKQ